MKSPLIVGVLLAALGLGLHAAAHHQEQAREQRLSDTLAVRPVLLPGTTPLTDSTGRSVEQVAAITLTLPDSPPVTYARRGGVWRALDYYLGVAEGQTIESVFQQIYEAEAVVEPARDEASLARYGLAADQRVLVELQGRELFEREDRHVLFALEVGAPRSGSTGSFLRVRGETEVLAANRDLATPLALDGPDPVPLLDERIATPGWVGFAAEPQAIRVEHTGGDAYWLRAPTSPPTGPLPTPSDPQAGIFEGRTGWTLEPDSLDARDLPAPWVLGFQLFIGSAEGGQLVDPRGIPLERQSRPSARLTFYCKDVEPLELVLLGSLPGKPAVVINLVDQTAREIEQEIVELLFPELVLFDRHPTDIPWDPYLR